MIRFSITVFIGGLNAGAGVFELAEHPIQWFGLFNIFIGLVILALNIYVTKISNYASLSEHKIMLDQQGWAVYSRKSGYGSTHPVFGKRP